MFDIGFSELCMVGLVTLLVVGPERLPKVARYAGFWIGKTRHMIASVKAEIREELQAEEMRQIFKEQAELKEVRRMLDDASDAANAIKSSLEQSQQENVKQVKQSHESE
ncbi:Sec-independent protein translocase protein TatB [Methylobacter luteus]|uniref:Sec-independent protein translocase protein TatB n=1 Tax=Methylobacter luteus TaxID=415 RepID=UPI0004277560|nr:Sec-independent protein translocase protein TatB [Methylobacter luteus]